MMYIGKKQFMLQKRHKNRRKYFVDSKWREYTGSCKKLNEDIKKLGKDNFKFEILELCRTKSLLSYTEANLQHRLEVMTKRDGAGNKVYYNGNIAAVKFQVVNDSEFSEERRIRIGEGRDYSKTDHFTPASVASHEAKKGKKWYNNGEEEFHLYPKEVRDGLVQGRILRKKFNKHCEECGVEYETNTSRSRFCTKKCQQANYYQRKKRK